MKREKLSLVVKIGSLALAGADGGPDLSIIGKISREIATLKTAGHHVLLVSSGAVGTGRSLCRAQTPLKQCDEVAERQIMASLGQAHLMALYQNALAPHGLLAAQILLTKQDFRTRTHHLHMTHLFAALERQPHILPIINENDSVTVDELMFTDNDELAGLLAAMMNADRLIILSHIEGVFDRPPSECDAEIIPVIDWQTKRGLPTSTKGKSSPGRGGMASKLGIARKMATLGIKAHIASAKLPDVLAKIVSDQEVGTTILPLEKKRNAVKRWLASDVPRADATVTANGHLAEIMRDPSHPVSLLPVGLTAIKGDFAKGDLVQVVDEKNARLALGVARCDAATLRRMLGKKQQPVFIHYDQLYRTAGE